MASVVLDTSALFALIHRERGWEGVEAIIAYAAMSAVNYAEAMTKLVGGGLSPAGALAVLARFEPEVVAFDIDHAEATGALVVQTRQRGLSLGDRACLALAIARGLPALTADRSWAGLDVGCEIRLIR